MGKEEELRYRIKGGAKENYVWGGGSNKTVEQTIFVNHAKKKFSLLKTNKSPNCYPCFVVFRIFLSIFKVLR